MRSKGIPGKLKTGAKKHPAEGGKHAGRIPAHNEGNLQTEGQQTGVRNVEGLISAGHPEAYKD